MKVVCRFSVSAGITANVSGLCDVVAFKAQMFNNPPMLNRNTNDE